jgi:hypothetical protein
VSRSKFDALKGAGKAKESKHREAGVVRSARATGKRSDPNYTKVLGYVRRDTYSDVTVELARMKAKGEKVEFSELLQEWMEQWLKRRR